MSEPINDNLILVISDLHLADGTGTDDFGNFGVTSEREDKLIAFINNYNPGKIIANGDIYELWQVKMKKIRIAHPKMLNFLETDSRVEFLVGNHDYKRSGKMYYSFSTQNNKIGLITHGFEVDKCMKSAVSRFFSWILGGIEKIIPGIENFFARKKFWNSALQEKVRDFAIKKFEKGYDIVVCAHCHVPKYEEIGGKIYANSGACQEGRLEGVLIDKSTGTVSLIP
ncbi:MAG: metallophosphoesterase family protein [Promethearchaeota archaeon]